MEKKKKILIINGPNLNLLGTREKDIYGELEYSSLVNELKIYCKSLGVSCEIRQSNYEGQIIDWIQDSKDFNGIVINPAGYTHTSVAILDAIRAISIPVIEVHISNIFGREDYRQKSITSGGCVGVISGLGKFGYMSAISYLGAINEKN